VEAEAAQWDLLVDQNTWLAGWLAGWRAHQVDAELAKTPSTTVPYRRNRMVFFHSDLWHRTDGTAFKVRPIIPCVSH
jgi:hypothetical protein